MSEVQYFLRKVDVITELQYTQLQLNERHEPLCASRLNGLFCCAMERCENSQQMLGADAGGAKYSGLAFSAPC
jgi:hypothetical protein